MAEKDLLKLLSSINPALSDKTFVFCVVSEEQLKTLDFLPLALFREVEGITLVIEKVQADSAFLSYSEEWSLITCTINSDLTAVGFLAAMSTRLAEVGIAVNAMSAFYHDHLFVPKARGHEACELLATFADSRT